MNSNRLLTYYLIILFITSFSFEIGYVFISSFYNSELICLVDLDTESEKTDNEDIKENKEKILSNEICGLSELDQFLLSNHIQSYNLFISTGFIADIIYPPEVH